VKSVNGSVYLGWRSLKGKGNLGMNVGRPTVINGDFVAHLREIA